MTDVELIKAFIGEYGPWAILLVILWVERKRILDGILAFFGQFWPSVNAIYERRQAARSLLLQSRGLERTDTISALKDVVQAYRHELDESKAERLMLQDKFLEVVADHSRREAQLIATLRDISDVLAHQSTRLDRIEGCLEAMSGKERRESNNPA